MFYIRFNDLRKTQIKNNCISNSGLYYNIVIFYFIMLDDGVSRSIEYNRRCARAFDEDICQLKGIEIKGEGFFTARICYFGTDNCNTNIE